MSAKIATESTKKTAKSKPEPASSTTDRKAYFQNYYKKNKDILSKKRRNRYRTDAEYRKQHLENTKKAREQRRVVEATPKFKRDLSKSEERFAGESLPSPRLMQIKGQPVSCHTTLALVRYLGRSLETMRRWLTEGVVPGVSYVDDSGDYWFTELFCKTLRDCVAEMYKRPRGRKSGHGDTEVLRELVAKAFKAKGIKVQKVR